MLFLRLNALKAALPESRNATNKIMSRFVTIVLDSGGVGALEDFSDFGDAPGANTVGNVARSVGGLALPNFGSLGLGSLTGIAGVEAAARPRARVARLR